MKKAMQIIKGNCSHNWWVTGMVVCPRCSHRHEYQCWGNDEQKLPGPPCAKCGREAMHWLMGDLEPRWHRIDGQLVATEEEEL